jgi:hypothetical protein
MAYNVCKVMKLSTAHLSEETAVYLRDTDCIDWPTVGGPYRDIGWFFHVDEDAGEEAVSPILHDLFETFRFAAAEGYEVIRFCNIERPIAELPIYRDMDGDVEDDEDEDEDEDDDGENATDFWEDDIVYCGSYDRRNAQGRPSAFVDTSVPPSADVATQALRHLHDQISEAHNDLLSLPLERLNGIAVDPASLTRWKNEFEKLNYRFLGFQAFLKYLTLRLSDESKPSAGFRPVLVA